MRSVEKQEQLKVRDFDLGDTATPRRFEIAKKDLTDHGYAAKCDGCRAALAGGVARPHSEERRRRIIETLGRSDPGLAEQKKRFDEFLDKATAKEDSEKPQARRKVRTQKRRRNRAGKTGSRRRKSRSEARSSRGEEMRSCRRGSLRRSSRGEKRRS